MDPFVITFILLFISPICAYIIYRVTKKGSTWRNRIFKRVLIITSFIFLMSFLGISTTSEVVDRVFVGIFLFGCYLIAWFAFDLDFIPKLLRVLIGFGLFVSLSITFLSLTIGFLGAGLILGDYEIHREKKLSNSMVYREYLKGNALSDYRLKEIVILRRPRILPFIEYIIARKKYYNWDIVLSRLDVDYIEGSNTINLKANIETDSTEVSWKDIIYLDKKD